MRKIYFLFLMLFFVSLVFGSTAAKLPDLIKPQTINVDDKDFVVTEGPNVFIYSLKDFKLKKRFGRAGKGPQKFIISPYWLEVSIQPDYLLVNSMSKVSFYKRDGSFIKEVTGIYPSFWLKPLGERYVARGDSMKKRDYKGIRYRSIHILGPDFKVIERIRKVENIKQKKKNIRLYTRQILYYPYKDKIFLPVGEDFLIKVLNKDGEQLYSINYDYKRVKVTEKDAIKVHEWYKKSPRFRDKYESEVKKLIELPEFYPAIRICNVVDDRIYVETYKRKDGKSEFLIFDLKGKLLKIQMIPITQANIFRSDPYTIRNGKVYLLRQDNEGTWELQIIPFDIK